MNLFIDLIVTIIFRYTLSIIKDRSCSAIKYFMRYQVEGVYGNQTQASIWLCRAI